MGLKSLRLPTETQHIPGSDEPVILHGITLPDLTQLALHHGPSLRKVFDELTAAVRGEESEPDGKEPPPEPNVEKAVRNATQGLSDDVKNPEESSDGLDMMRLFEGMVRISPRLVGEIIALSAKEPDAIDEAAQLPFPLMLEALEKVFRVTFATEGGVKNFVETVIRVANALTVQMTALAIEEKVLESGPASTIGSGSSGAE